jgi:hypothetical protein
MMDEIWTMKDGTEIAVGDMSESHVRNTLRMLLRKQRESQEKWMEYDQEDWERDFWEDEGRYGTSKT